MKIDLTKADVEMMEDALKFYELSQKLMMRPVTGALARHLATLRAKLKGEI